MYLSFSYYTRALFLLIYLFKIVCDNEHICPSRHLYVTFLSYHAVSYLLHFSGLATRSVALL